MQSVAIEELFELLGERAHAMMFFLVRDVPRYLIHIRFRYGERAVASAPSEFYRNDII
jgi:hypothetical protein